MARIDYSDPEKHNDRTRELLGKNRNANIFRMMAHSPSYLSQYCRLGGAIRNRGELDPIVRELAITRTGILCEAPYEVVAHKRIGKISAMRRIILTLPEHAQHGKAFR